MGKPLFSFVNQSLGQHLAYSKGIFFHLDAYEYVFRRKKKPSSVIKSKKKFGTPVYLLNQIYEYRFIHFIVHHFCTYLALCVHSQRVKFLYPGNTKEAPLPWMQRYILYLALGFTLMNSLTSLIRASWPE